MRGLLLASTAYPLSKRLRRLALVPSANADVGKLDDQRMPVTVDQPLQIPGRELPAGTYWLTMRHPETEGSTAVIYAADQTTPAATLNTAPGTTGRL